MAAERLVTAGYNANGQCLVEGAREIGVPTIVPLESLTDGKLVLRAATGSAFTLLLDSDGEVWGVGSNGSGQLGDGRCCSYGDGGDGILQRATGIGTERIVQVAAGMYSSAAVTQSGHLLVWGDGSGAGPGEATRCTEGALADAHARVVFVTCCGMSGKVALTHGGAVILIGNTPLGSHKIPALFTGNAALTGVRIVGCAASTRIVLLVSDAGHVYAHVRAGLFGTDGLFGEAQIDAQHFGGTPIVAVAAGKHHMLALTAEGHVYAWGGGKDGATGLGRAGTTETPQRVLGALADALVVRIAAGHTHSLALTDAGQVFVFGTDGGATWTCGAQQYLDEDFWDGDGDYDDEGPHYRACGTYNGGSIQHGEYGRDCCNEYTEDACVGTRPVRWRHPHLLQDALADITVCSLGSGSSAEHSVFVPGAPPSSPGFDLLLAAVQKPAAKQPDPAAVAAAGGGYGATKQQQQEEEVQHEGGGAAAASAAEPCAVQGLARKRKADTDLADDDHDDDKDAAHDDHNEDDDAEAAVPLC